MLTSNHRGLGHEPVTVAEQKPVLRRDGSRNALRPDAIAALLETDGPHDIDRDRTVDPSRQRARIAGRKIVATRQDGDARGRGHGAVEHVVGQPSARVA